MSICSEVVKVSVITVSDTCFSGNKKDDSGPALVAVVGEVFKDADIENIIVPDSVSV